MNEVLYRTKELLERKLGETVNSGNMNALGQYTSRDGGSYPTYDHGYSGHSVNDVMIMALEHSITPDMSEIEKQRIYDQIKMIRERKD